MSVTIKLKELSIPQKSGPYTITPELAAHWKERNTENQRKINHLRVQFYKEQILSNRWMLTGQTIIFDWNNHLLDGQNRLEAIIQSGKAVDVWVVTKVDPAAFKFIDTGKPRSGGDIFAIRQIKYSVQLAALTKMIAGYQQESNPKTALRKLMPGDCLLDLHDQFPQLIKSCAFVQSHGVNTMKGRFSNFMHASIALIEDEATANDFYMGYSVGNDLSVGDSRLYLRNLIMANKTGNSERVKPYVLWASCIEAVNQYLAGKKSTPMTIKYNDKRELFPRLDNCPWGYPTQEATPTTLKLVG